MGDGIASFNTSFSNSASTRRDASCPFIDDERRPMLSARCVAHGLSVDHRDRKMMKRRTFVAGMGAVLIASPRELISQQAPRRVGALIGASGTNLPPFEDELTKLGWKIGQTLRIEYRFSGGDTAVTRAQARELLALDLDVLLVQTNTAMAAVYA